MDAHGCWIPHKVANLNGYVQIQLPLDGDWDSGRRANEYAHRVAWVHEHGTLIPANLTIDHVHARECRSRACCNPVHIELVTIGENVRRGTGPTAANARKTTCDHGHPLEGYNVYIHKGKRQCQTCRREHTRRAQRATRARNPGMVRERQRLYAARYRAQEEYVERVVQVAERIVE